MDANTLAELTCSYLICKGSLPFHRVPALFFLSETDIWVDLQLAFSCLSNCWDFSLSNSTSTHSTKSPETFQCYWFCLESLSVNVWQKKVVWQWDIYAALFFFFSKQKYRGACMYSCCLQKQTGTEGDTKAPMLPHRLWQPLDISAGIFVKKQRCSLHLSAWKTAAEN